MRCKCRVRKERAFQGADSSSAPRRAPCLRANVSTSRAASGWKPPKTSRTSGQQRCPPRSDVDDQRRVRPRRGVGRREEEEQRRRREVQLAAVAQQQQLLDNAERDRRHQRRARERGRAQEAARAERRAGKRRWTQQRRSACATGAFVAPVAPHRSSNMLHGVSCDFKIENVNTHTT